MNTKENMMSNQPELTPEQRAQIHATEMMDKFIEENGMDAMIVKQIEWKLNDNNAKVAAASNIKAWFETAYEIADLRSKGLLLWLGEFDEYTLEEIVNIFNDEKIAIYKSITEVYEGLKPEDFGENFVNKFAELWQAYEGKRTSMMSSIKELYAWTIFEDSVRWASGINSMVLQHKTQQEFVEETI